jgi:hypothetical protein
LFTPINRNSASRPRASLIRRINAASPHKDFSFKGAPGTKFPPEPHVRLPELCVRTVLD